MISLKRKIIGVFEEGPATAPYVARVLGHKRTSIAAAISKLHSDGFLRIESHALPLARHEAGRRPRLYAIATK